MSSLYQQQLSDGELDFNILFEYETPAAGGPGQDDPNLASHKLLSPESEQAFPLEEVSPYASIKSCSRAYIQHNAEVLPGYDSQEGRSYLDGARPAVLALSPRIEITPSREHYIHAGDSQQNQHPSVHSPRPTLTVPGHESLSYREPQCLSPASSNSSTSWHSESYSPWASPCVSPGSGHNDLCPRLQNIHAGSPRTSPGTSPCAGLAEDGYLGACSPSPRPGSCSGSRSTSPQGKRTYDMYKNPSLVPGIRSRSPSPHGGQEDHGMAANYTPGGPNEAVNGFGSCLPTKIVKTSNQVYTLYPEHHSEGNYLVSCDQDLKPAPEPFFVIPPIWPKPLVSSICSIPVASLPPLEWPMPGRTDHYQLHIEVQPKPHHRAHYETEGSRGAVKAHTEGHPVVQLRGYKGKEPLGLQIFIGTADERILKPHAFYQVHRITGKTVTTNSFEKVVHGTKVLEIPLEPKNNMRAIIDCAGILKLRNADIELRKGETDVGRKNTRVRLVFRVHIPQPGGQLVSLQVASHPVECSQRSAHELPVVEKQDLDSCCVLGGQQMILTGQNFSSDSKVLFTEKTHDGMQVWESEATVDKDKSQPSILFVEVPSYRDSSVCRPIKVTFCVVNGKRKRSQPQHFAYTPLPSASIKTEPLDEYDSDHVTFAMMGPPPHSYYPSPRRVLHPDHGLLSGVASCQRLGPGFDRQSAAFPRGEKSGACQQTGTLIPDSHRSVLVRTGSPAHPPIIQFSPTNHHQEPPAVYCGSYSPPPPQQYTTVIQQQKARGPGGDRPRRVTVKEENLDQAYLDDGELNEIIRKDLTGVHARGQS
ncbi:nuclear factor of activated T-cells, cytoplasmic 2 isoform X1 [Nerophis lumbriciformis]|uniref:nuclear factor of activated T-cells, cytoplasmic 2 isoform X1 n=1 Tax=Nerophis lumbriciformis TaxID=546530 RepID=UPI002ADFD2FD|nr:nuclear factor of activated T-cells, cytoplasmic 2 isoform X1 [Nerophis lumbriciformis]